MELYIDPDLDPKLPEATKKITVKIKCPNKHCNVQAKIKILVKGNKKKSFFVRPVILCKNCFNYFREQIAVKL